MALTNEDLQAIAALLQPLKDGMVRIEERMEKLENRMEKLEERMDKLEERMDKLENRVDRLDERVGGLENRMTKHELHMENGTDKNIQLLAENFVELTKKLNQAVPAADKNLAYEVKVNYLMEEVEKLKEQVAEISIRTA